MARTVDRGEHARTPLQIPKRGWKDVLKRTKNCHGFYGASSMERLPVETALKAQTERFKAISF